MSTVNIGSSAQWSQLLKTSSIVVADFYADWCGPCKMIAPVFESLALKHSKPNRITFAKVNVDQQAAVAEQYGVNAMPTFVILHNGSPIETLRGPTPSALATAVSNAVRLAGNAPSASGAAFTTPGRKLGSTSSSTSGTSPTTGGRTGGGAAGRLTRSRPVFDLNALINALITFFGLYFTSLFSFDPYMAAQNSKYNVKNPAAQTPAAIPSVRISTGQKPAAGSKASFKTLADLGAE